MDLEVRPAPLPDGARGGFTTRAGGVSEGAYASANLALHVGDEPERVLENRAALGRRYGAPVCFAQQVHGAGVLVLDRALAGDAALTRAAPGVDALVTALPGVPVAALVADCMPILLADPHAGVVAAVHAGRAGLLAGVLQAAVAAMRDLGADPAATTAVVGPAARGCCYEVPARMRDDVAAAVPGTAARTRSGRPSLDLPTGAAGVLRAAGVGDVRLTATCTIDDTSCFSYRRERTTGRFAGVAVLDAR